MPENLLLAGASSPSLSLFMKLFFFSPFLWRRTSDWPLNDENEENRNEIIIEYSNKRRAKGIRKSNFKQLLNWNIFFYCLLAMKKEFFLLKASEKKTAQSEWVLMSWVWTIHLLSWGFDGGEFDLTTMIVSREVKRISDSYHRWAVNAQ